MKKTLVKILTTIIGFATVFGLTGCSGVNATKEMNEKLNEYVSQYNYFREDITKKDSKINNDYYIVDGYIYNVSAKYDSFSGYEISTGGANSGFRLYEESVDTADIKNYYTDKYIYEEYESLDSNTKIDYIIEIPELKMGEECEKVEKDGKTTYKLSDLTYVFEKNKITIKNSKETIVYNFKNKDKPFIKQTFKDAKSCQGKSRKYVKQKLGYLFE